MHVKNITYMGNRGKKSPYPGSNAAEMSVKGIVYAARGSLTQTGFVELLDKQYGIKTSQGLISKYESGKANSPSTIIDIYMEIIHGENIPGEVSVNELEERIRKVLIGPAQAEARRAFAVILDHLSLTTCPPLT